MVNPQVCESSRDLSGAIIYDLWGEGSRTSIDANLKVDGRIAVVEFWGSDSQIKPPGEEMILAFGGVLYIWSPTSREMKG